MRSDGPSSGIAGSGFDIVEYGLELCGEGRQVVECGGVQDFEVDRRQKRAVQSVTLTVTAPSHLGRQAITR